MDRAVGLELMRPGGARPEDEDRVAGEREPRVEARAELAAGLARGLRVIGQRKAAGERRYVALCVGWRVEPLHLQGAVGGEPEVIHPAEAMAGLEARAERARHEIGREVVGDA